MRGKLELAGTRKEKTGTRQIPSSQPRKHRTSSPLPSTDGRASERDWRESMDRSQHLRVVSCLHLALRSMILNTDTVEFSALVALMQDGGRWGRIGGKQWADRERNAPPQNFGDDLQGSDGSLFGPAPALAPALPRRRMWATRRMASNRTFTSPALSFELVARCSVSRLLEAPASLSRARPALIMDSVLLGHRSPEPAHPS